ncbi:MAG: ATP-dependent zinc metalloprotease FtsH [Sphaerochaetaceae bacterium]|nr:ATP-dependent zinc metalloprotease FtsH [Sphaerochaetaceae bacterium]
MNQDDKDLKDEKPQDTPQNESQGSKEGQDNQKPNTEPKRDSNGYWRPSYSNKQGGSKSAFTGPAKRKNIAALVAFALLIVAFAMTFFSGSQYQEVRYDVFLSELESGNVKSAVIKAETKIEFSSLNFPAAKTRIPYYDSTLMEKLVAKGVAIQGAAEDVSALAVLLNFLPWVIFIAFAVMLMRQTSGNGMMMNYGKNLSKEYTSNDPKVTFKDVAGQKEAKYEVQEIVDFLKNPEKFKEIGAKIPRGVLLVGPPGTGKTLLARAIAGEAGVSFFHTSGSDFVEMFVGMGAARVRDLFNQGRAHAPCILFIDELDAVGRSRGSGLGGGHDEREQTLNQMLVEMDGFDTSSGVIVIAATNRPDVLDPALLRPGRFDRQVVVDLPDVKEREEILKIHAAKVKLDPDVDLERIARATSGTSGADLANLVNEAALFAAREKRKTVNLADFEQAHDKILLGVARKSKVMTAEEKLATAYHEGGHTLLFYYLDHLDPLHKVTIIPHGQALGVTISLPEKDSYSHNRSSLEDMIKMSMGGYVAEKLVYGQTTTGTAQDIKQATNIARRMVTEWGMSNLGFISLGAEDEPLFLGRSIAQHKSYSESTAAAIDNEVEKILSSCLEKSNEIISAHRDQLDLLAKTLVEKETMDDAEVRELLGFEPLQSVTKLV